MKIGQISVPYETLHAVYCYFSLENSKGRSRPVTSSVKATFHLTIFMRGERATGKIQRNNCHHGSCGSSLTCETSSVSLIFTYGTYRNVKNR